MKKAKALSLTLVSLLTLSMFPFSTATASAAFEKNDSQLVEDITLGWNLGNAVQP